MINMEEFRIGHFIDKVAYSKEAREEMFKGIDALYNAVKVTLGPKGRNVVLFKNMEPHITKDGITVAENFNLKDSLQNTGVQIVKQAARKTAQESGDGPQPLYAKILTPTGWTTMGDLKVGDEICGTNGTIQIVEGIYPKGKKEVVELHWSNKQVVECCEDHLWTVYTPWGTKKTLSVSDMLNTGIVAKKNNKCYKYYTPKTFVEFSSKEISLDPFLVGLLLGDGSLSGTGSIELSIAMDKRHVLDKIILPENIGYTATDIPSKNYIRVKFKRLKNFGKTMFDYINDLGLLGTKSSTKFIPKNYLYNDMKVREQLLEGLTMTDGHINSRGLLEYSTISEQLYIDVLELLNSLGKVCYHYKMDRKSVSSYSQTPIYKITELLGYKYGHKLINIVKTGKFEEMQCIKVSNPDHLYITNDYIVTHNTTSSVILTYNIISEGLKYLNNSNTNPIELKKGMEMALNSFKEIIKSESIPVDSADVEKIKQVAAISANNDESIGELIAEAVSKIGKDGTILVENSYTKDTYVEINTGMTLDKGYVSKAFINNPENGTIEFEDCEVVIFDNKITTVQEIKPMISSAVESKIPLVLMAPEFSNEVLSFLSVNNSKGIIQVAPIYTPGYGITNKQEISEDIRAYCDCPESNSIGHIDKIIVSDNKTVIVNDTTNVDNLNERIKLLKSQLHNYDSEPLRKRLSNLSGGIATIFIGATTEVEMKEKKDRIDDAICAVKAALEEGIILGGSTTALYAYIYNNESNTLDTENENIIAGYKIVTEAILTPLKVNLENAGLNYDRILHTLMFDMAENHIGFNVKTEVYENMLKSGIIEPAKVLRTSLENAVSAASTFLTTECAIMLD